MFNKGYNIKELKRSQKIIKLKNMKKGFTLIELLIIIAIIAILAAGVIIAINPGRHFREARNSTRWSQMNSIANAVYTYVIATHGNFPACIPVYPTRVNVEVCAVNLIPDHLSSIPRDPQTGYHYEVGFDNVEGHRIRVTSTATEAVDIIIIR